MQIITVRKPYFILSIQETLICVLLAYYLPMGISQATKDKQEHWKIKVKVKVKKIKRSAIKIQTPQSENRTRPTGRVIVPAGNEPAGIVLAVEGVVSSYQTNYLFIYLLPARCSDVSLGPFWLAQTDSLLPSTEDSKTEKGNKLQCTAIYDTVDCFIMM